MKKTILIVLILFFTVVSFSQKKVAVYVTGNDDNGISKVLGDKLVESFVKSGSYSAIERTASFLIELSKEQKISGNYSDSDLIIVGKKFGVDFICIVEINDVLSQKYISARLININSAEIVNSSNSGNLPLNTIDDLIVISDKLAFELSGLTGKEKYNLAVQKAESEQIQQSVDNIIDTVGLILGGSVILVNQDKDPFDVFINNQFVGVIDGYQSIEKQLPKGNHHIKVVERSGYILVRQVEVFNIYIKKNSRIICKWN